MGTVLFLCGILYCMLRPLNAGLAPGVLALPSVGALGCFENEGTSGLLAPRVPSRLISSMIRLRCPRLVTPSSSRKSSFVRPVKQIQVFLQTQQERRTCVLSPHALSRDD